MKLSIKEIEKELRLSQEYFERSTRVLSEEDSEFAPAEGTMTVAQQVAHVAQTIDWFLDGAFSVEGFNLDFAEHAAALAKNHSLSDSRALVSTAFARLFDTIASTPEADWEVPMAAGLVMGGEPRKQILFGLIEHTAHHRGALTVYSRLCGKTPLMPYLEI